ncbi:ABC transporter permease [Halorarius halobius]|uniref:ABC transporter permease n=1 Tax=Halorarius halobius TaxID=2962671 RepID=UPI0020CCCBAB|nr:ABC transporter permease [Halorarius halobius]
MSDAPARFETVEWESLGDERRLGRAGRAFVAALAALAVVFVYDFAVLGGKNDDLIAWGLVHDGEFLFAVNFDPTGMTWLVALSVLLLVFTVVVPLATNRALAARYWRRLRENRLATLALGYLVVGTLAGFLAPLLLGGPEIHTKFSYQPPLFGTVPHHYPLLRCAGAVTDGICHGSLWAPLGTDQLGRGMGARVVVALKVSMTVGLVTSMLIVPLATAVGTAAGYIGGRVDDLLMRYVDIQQTIPAILIYLVLVLPFGRSLFLIVVVFGLLSWGGVARVVRGEVLQRSEATYVTAAKSYGASDWWIVRRHVLPNTSNAVFTALSLQIPVLILAEAALAYLQLGERYSESFGNLIALGMRSVSQSFNFPGAWWIAAVPAVFLAATVLSFNVLGDALRDVLDPRGNS